MVVPLLVLRSWVKFKTPLLFIIAADPTLAVVLNVIVPQAVFDTVSAAFWFQLLAQVKLPVFVMAAPLLIDTLFITTVPLFVRAAEKVFAVLGANFPPV